MTDTTPESLTSKLPVRVSELVSQICERNPTHQKFLKNALPGVAKQELEHLDAYIDFCVKCDLSIPYLVECYLLLVTDSITESIYFARHGEYRYSTFEQVAGHVYFNDDYMHKYMHGLAISLIFWPSHRAIHRFFKRVLPTRTAGAYLEVGPGHGSFLMEAMRTCAYDSFLGIDISEASISQTGAILDHFQPENRERCTLIAQDFFESESPPNSYAAIVMGEVLEHVEDPGSMLAKIHELAKDDAFIFVTTCVNAPQIDHIYLFRTLDEVSDLIAHSSLKIVESHAAPYEGKTLEQCLKQCLPINVAYVLEKS